jgi:Type II CAAX prenyl endopeptidase Rce1-like
MPTIDTSSLPGISALPDFLRALMALGITLFLVIHRFDAERFNAAEYDDTDRWGNPPSLFRRLAWYFLGLLGILAVLVLHPSPSTDLYLALGDRLGVLVLGIAYAAGGTLAAVGLAYWRYGYVRLPFIPSYPGAVLNAIATAFVDEAVFRGIVFGFLITIGTDPNLANLTQTLLYGLATRTGAPGRPKSMLLVMLAIGFVGGWLTGVTAGIGAAFLGHAITRLAFFLTTGHPGGLPAPKGTEQEEIVRRARPPKGWKVLDETDEPDPQTPRTGWEG